MEVGLVMNRSILFPSLDLILPICKHVEVFVYFPYPTRLGCFTRITQEKNSQKKV